MADMTAESGFALAWEDEAPAHPVLEQLRSQPNRWAVLWQEGQPKTEEYLSASSACAEHPRVEKDFVTRQEGDMCYIVAVRVRWVPQ